MTDQPRNPRNRECRSCGHPESTHHGFSGPNSIGQWSHGECTYGSKSIPPYRFGGCDCSDFAALPWWRRALTRKPKP